MRRDYDRLADVAPAVISDEEHFLDVSAKPFGRALSSVTQHFCRVCQDRIYTPYMTVYLVIFQPEIPYIHRI
jgi:hypothetical protein